MALPGRELVGTIQALLEVQTRNEQRMLVLKMTEIASVSLQNCGIVGHADEVFDLFRSIDKEHGFSSEVLDRRRGIVANRLHNWGLRDLEEAGRVADSLYENYIPLRRELFGSRSRSAHVSAVLRPFSKKYLNIWAEGFGERFDLTSVSSRVERLNDTYIENEVDLQRWSDQVYELFSSVAVIPADSTEKRVMGTIRAASERTYRQQWNFWMRNNAKSLLTGEFDATVASYEPAYLPGFAQDARSFNYRSDYDQRPIRVEVPASTPAAEMAAGPSQPVSIKLTCLANDSLNAERTWLHKPEAIAELGDWVKNMGLFWGGDEIEIAVELGITTSSGESKFNLPSMPLGAAGETLKKALQSYR